MARKSNASHIDGKGVYHGTTSVSADQSKSGAAHRDVPVTFKPRVAFKGETDQDYGFYLAGAVPFHAAKATATLRKGGEKRAIVAAMEAAGVTTLADAMALLASHGVSVE